MQSVWILLVGALLAHERKPRGREKGGVWKSEGRVRNLILISAQLRQSEGQTIPLLDTVRGGKNPNNFKQTKPR